MGKNWFDNFVPARVKSELLAVSSKLFSGKEGAEFHENPVLTKSGEERLIAWHNTALRDDKGKAIGYLSSGEDVTERKRAEERLVQSEKKYSTIVEKGNDGIVIIQDGRLIFANSRTPEITGLPLDKVLGRSFIDFVSPAYRGLVADNYKRRISGEKAPDRYEIEILSKDGESIPVEITGSAIEYEGKPADMVVIRDICERKRAEEMLLKYRMAVEASADLISAVNSQYVYVLANQTYLKYHWPQGGTKLLDIPLPKYWVKKHSRQSSPT